MMKSAIHERLVVRKLSAPIFVSLVAVGLLLAPGAASAATSKLYVTPTYGYTDACRPAAGQLRIKFLFQAKFQRKNSPYPRNVKMYYRVKDAVGNQIASGKVTLTKKGGWKKKSGNVTVASGSTSYFLFTAKYISPITHRNLKSVTPASQTWATDDELIQNGIPPC